MAHSNRLQDAHVLVFGGTSGIGFGVASMALSNGAYVTISGSRQPKVDDKVALLRSLYPDIPASKVSGYAVDLHDSANLEKNLIEMFDVATNKGQRKIDHISFTAGDGLVLPNLKEVAVEAIMPGFAVRFAAPVMIAKLLTTGTYMPLSTSSSFTLTGGVNTKKPMPGWFMAASWGAAVEGLTRGLAVDIKPIRVNMVEPGIVDTELLRGFFQAEGGEEKKEAMKMMTLTQTIGRPEDTAEAYAWFMRDRFVTGVLASSNGGQLLASPGL